jgi:hypothetical protein
MPREFVPAGPGLVILRARAAPRPTAFPKFCHPVVAKALVEMSRDLGALARGGDSEARDHTTKISFVEGSGNLNRRGGDVLEKVEPEHTYPSFQGRHRDMAQPDHLVVVGIMSRVIWAAHASLRKGFFPPRMRPRAVLVSRRDRGGEM